MGIWVSVGVGLVKDSNDESDCVDFSAVEGFLGGIGAGDTRRLGSVTFRLDKSFRSILESHGWV